jgi:hypothetical protein
MSESQFAFVPPTSPEIVDEFGHLRPEIIPGEAMHEIDPFTLFSEIGEGLITSEGLNSEEVVVEVQLLSGQQLNTQGIRNMLGWSQEIIKRQVCKKDPNWETMTKSARMGLLFGVEIDFGEPSDKERMAV